MTSRHMLWAAALALCACQYVADLRPSDVSPRDAGADAADLDADAPDRDAEADQPRDPDADAEGDPAPDPDVPDDDGGVTGCTDNAQCDDGKECTGVETCDLGTHTCLPGISPWDGYPCDDADPCTASSHCDGAGTCVPGNSACDDGRTCTTDTCTVVDPTSYECDTVLNSDTCLIDGQCYASYDLNPSNDCQYCEPFLRPLDWYDRSDGTACSSGRCCDGICHVGASCCADGDCPTGCAGTPLPCSSYSSEFSCQDQSGCTWQASADPPVCTGTAVDCETFNEEECRNQEGCRIFDGVCLDNACT